MSSAPQHGRAGCRARVYLYESYLKHLQLQQHSGRFFGFPKSERSGNASCLEAPCRFDSFTTYNVRQYTSEVPIYRRIVSKCPLVSEPEKADIFLVPFYFGYMMTLGWQVKRPGTPSEQRVEHRQMMNAALALHKSLPYLTNETAHKHVFLFTCDSQFVNLLLHDQLKKSMVVHLGDDGFNGNTHSSNYVQQHDVHYMPRSIIVPYRVSQWMPFGFNRTAFVGRRRLLLSMNVNMDRHPVRRHVASSIRQAATALNVSRDRFSLSPRMMGPEQAAQVALTSTFCLCPTGDSKGFTARFYFVLLHGCLPIRVDGYRRNASLAPPIFPFPRLIDWPRIMIDLAPDEAAGLLPRLLAMPQREIEERQSYLRHVAHWLLFDDEEHAHHDAATALVHTLQSHVLGEDAADLAGEPPLLSTGPPPRSHLLHHSHGLPHAPLSHAHSARIPTETSEPRAPL